MQAGNHQTVKPFHFVARRGKTIFDLVRIFLCFNSELTNQ